MNVTSLQVALFMVAGVIAGIIALALALAEDNRRQVLTRWQRSHSEESQQILARAEISRCSHPISSTERTFFMTQMTFTRSVSTWSLHRTLGSFVAENSSPKGGRMMRLPPVDAGISLLELPAELAARGYQAVQICHFHIASTDDAYLDSLRGALESNGIELDVLLVDAGDVTADDAEHQLAWISDWIAIAARLGAKRARVCAGQSGPTPELLDMSGARLASLAKAHPGIRLLTENWKELTPDTASTLAVLDAAGEQVGLMIDLGNWTGAHKYDDLVKIAPRAEASHIKCHFDTRGPDEADFRQSLSILRDAGYTGSLCMIYDGPDDDEWRHLDWEWAATCDVFGIAPSQATG